MVYESATKLKQTKYLIQNNCKWLCFSLVHKCPRFLTVYENYNWDVIQFQDDFSKNEASLAKIVKAIHN